MCVCTHVCVYVCWGGKWRTEVFLCVYVCMHTYVCVGKAGEESGVCACACVCVGRGDGECSQRRVNSKKKIMIDLLVELSCAK